MDGLKSQQEVKRTKNTNRIIDSFLKTRTINGRLCGSLITSKQKLAEYISKTTQNSNSPTVLAKSIGERETTIIENKDGSYDLFCNRPEVSTLVLSGGGAKGCAHQGVYRAIEDCGRLKSIKKVSGTSAGSMISCLVSTGMQASEIQHIMDNMKPHAMVSSNDTIKNELSVYWDQKSSESTKLLTTKKHLIDEENLPKTIIEKIKFYFYLFVSLFINREMRACKLEKFLCYVTSNYFLQKISELNQQQQQELSPLIEKLKYQKDSPTITCQTGDRLTFADLDKLSKYLPDMKQLDINATIIANGTAQTIIYNSSNTPDMDIYKAVRISASFPGLFPKYKNCLLLNPKDQNTKSSEKLKILQTDGGYTANTPVTGVQKRKELLCNNYYIDDNKDNIIIVFGNYLIDSTSIQRPTYSLGDAFKDFILGTPITSTSYEENEIIREFYLDQTIMTRLAVANNGSIITNSTTNVLISEKDVHLFQSSAYEQVKSHIERSDNQLIGNNYETLKQALFAMKDEHLKDFLNGLEANKKDANNDIIFAETRKVVEMRKYARSIMEKIKQDIASYDDNTTSSKEEKIAQLKNILADLDSQYSKEEEFKGWFAFEMHNSDETQLNRYIDLTKDTSKNIESAFLLSLAKESQKRSHKYKVYHIIKTEIEPMIFKLGQSKENIALLENIKTSLLCTEDENEINYLIRQLQDLYKLTRLDKIRNLFSNNHKKPRSNA